MSEIRLPRAATMVRRLGGLEQTEAVMAAVCSVDGELRPEVETLIAEGLTELIVAFNDLDADDPVLEMLPETRALKERLAGELLPELDQIQGRDVLRGVRVAAERMELGQKLKRGHIGPEDRQRWRVGVGREQIMDDDEVAVWLGHIAIGTPSMETHPVALAVGTAAHLYERAAFAYMQRMGIGGDRVWMKDQVLFALEDMAMVMGAEARLSGSDDEEPILLALIASPNSRGEEGGLGWRQPDDVEKFEEQYALMRLFTEDGVGYEYQPLGEGQVLMVRMKQRQMVSFDGPVVYREMNKAEVDRGLSPASAEFFEIFEARVVTL